MLHFYLHAEMDAMCRKIAIFKKILNIRNFEHHFQKMFGRKSYMFGCLRKRARCRCLHNQDNEQNAQFWLNLSNLSFSLFYKIQFIFYLF